MTVSSLIFRSAASSYNYRMHKFEKNNPKHNLDCALTYLVLYFCDSNDNKIKNDSQSLLSRHFHNNNKKKI